MPPQPSQNEDQQSWWQYQEDEVGPWWEDPTDLTPQAQTPTHQPRRNSKPSQTLKPQAPKPWWKLEAQQTLSYARERLVANLRREIEEADEPTTTEEANCIVRQARAILAILKSDANAQSEKPIPVGINIDEWFKAVSSA